MPQFIDLSIPITNDVISDPPVMRPQISYITHENTWEQIAMFFPGLTKDDLPDGEGWAVESLTLSTHNGTHMDAPWHFHSTTDAGARPAPSIDEAPLDLFFAFARRPCRQCGGSRGGAQAYWLHPSTTRHCSGAVWSGLRNG